MGNWVGMVTICHINSIDNCDCFCNFGLYFNLRRKVDFEQQITNLKLRFFTDISHELRTPLTLIASPIEEVIDHEKLSEEGRENMLIAKRIQTVCYVLLTNYLILGKYRITK